MTERYLVARLRLSANNPFDDLSETYTLERVNETYRLTVYSRRRMMETQSQRSLILDTEQVQAQLDALKVATVPAFPVSELVMDGRYVELTVRGDSSTLTLGWWSIAPKGAEALDAFADWLCEMGEDKSSQA